MRKKVNDFPNLLNEWHPTKNGNLQPEDISYGSIIKLWWKCPVANDHEWETTPNARTNNGNGCPCCDGKKVVLSNCLATTHPEIAKQLHPTKNGEITSYQIVAGSNKKLWWMCPMANDHEWEAPPSDRVAGHGCGCCAGRKIVLSNCLATTHPELATQLHLTKNGKTTAYNVTSGSHTQLWWTCPIAKDHEWKISPNSRTNKKTGCPCCGGHKIVLSNCLATTHPEIAKQLHPTKNGKITAYKVVAGSNKKLWWQCPVAKDHEWQMVINNRCGSQNQSCSCCAGKKVVLSNCLATTHPEIAKQLHPTKNGNITAYKVVAGSNKKLWWVCSKNKSHQWVTPPITRSEGHGCPFCNDSKGEQKITNHLSKLKLIYIKQARFKTCRYKKELPFDFLVNVDNCQFLIEYQGRQHYTTVLWSRKMTKKEANLNLIALQERDKIKQEWCKNNNFPILIITYLDFDNIEQLIENYIGHLTKLRLNNQSNMAV